MRDREDIPRLVMDRRYKKRIDLTVVVSVAWDPWNSWP